jgi:transposase
MGEVWVPRAGWVRFRWSRQVPQDVKSFRVTMDRAGRWHVAFAVVPEPIEGPGTGETVGVDRGVAVSAALSTGELLHCPGLAAPHQRRLRRLERKLARAKRGSERRKRVRHAVARLKARSADIRKDWCEKTSTDIAGRFDVIRVEDLKIGNMTRSANGSIEQPGRNVRQKAGLNREIMRSGWGLLVRRLEDKAPGRVEKGEGGCQSRNTPYPRAPSTGPLWHADSAMASTVLVSLGSMMPSSATRPVAYRASEPASA